MIRTVKFGILRKKRRAAKVMRLLFLGKDRYTFLRGNMLDFYGNDKHAKTNTLFTNHAQIVVRVLKDALLVTLVQSITREMKWNDSASIFSRNLPANWHILGASSSPDASFACLSMSISQTKIKIEKEDSFFYVQMICVDYWTLLSSVYSITLSLVHSK